MKKLNMYKTAKAKIKNFSRLSKINLSVFALIFAALGAYVIFNSQAATIGSALPAPLPESTGTKITATNTDLSTQIKNLQAGNILCLPGGVVYGLGSTSDVTISVNGSASNPITIETCAGSSSRAEIAQRLNIFGSYIRIRNVKVTKNAIPTDTRTGATPAQSGGLPGGNVNIWLNGASHVTIENSEITGSTMSGIFGSGSYNQVINNYVHNNGTTSDDHGIYFAGDNSLIANNIFYDNFDYGVQIAYAKAINNIISNNTLVHNGYGAPTHPGSGTVTFSGTTNNKFVNNIALNNAKYGFETYDAATNGNTLANNDAYGNALGSTSGTFASNVSLLNLNPTFVSATDFHLQSSSPLATANYGDPAYTPVKDFAGTTRTNAVLGAYAYEAGSTGGTTSAFTNWKWNAAQATVDPNSSGLMSTWTSYAINSPNLATGAYGVATASATSADPSYSIPLTQQGGSITARIPLGTQPVSGSDHHLTVLDTTNNTEIDFWQAVYDSTTRKIASASAAVSFPAGSVNEKTTGWGGNAANTPLARGLVTPEAIAANSGAGDPDAIGTLQFGNPYVGGTSSTKIFPALHNAPTCGSSCTNHLPEGTWLRLDPAFDVNASTLPAWQKTIARAAQKYGMILRDNSGALAIYAKNPINGGMTWGSTAVGSADYPSMSGFPWARLQVLLPPSDCAASPTSSTCGGSTTPPPPSADTTLPTAPTTFTATASAYNNVDLTWSGASDNIGVTSYDIYRGTGTATPTLLKNVTTTSSSDTTVSASTSYSYYIKAKDAANNTSPASTTKTVTTPAVPDTTPPTVPAGVTATAKSDTQIDLAWSPSSDNNSVAKYNVYLNGSTTPLAQPTTTSYSHTGLTQKTTYSYQIAAEDAAGNISGKSASVSATTAATPDTTAPTTTVTAPASGATVSGTSVALAATATDNTGGTGVAHVDFYVDGTLLSSDSSSPYTGTLNSTALTNDSHTIQTYAYDGSNNLGKSTAISFTVFNDTTPPTAPVLTGKALSDTQVSLSWTASTDNVGVAGYRVVRTDGKTVQLSSSTLTYTDSSLAAGTTYGYTVVAYDAANNTASSNNVNLTTLTPPPADTTVATPTGLSATLISESQVNLSWNPVTDPSGIKGYNVYRNGTKVASLVTTTSWGEANLTAGTTYSYTVTAVDGANNESTKSTAASVTTPLPPPPTTITYITLTPTDDAFVNSRRPNRNFGNATTLNVQSSPTKNTLFKFGLTGVGSRIVKSAKLKIYVSGSSVSGGNFHKITNNSWTQSSVTWNTKPSFDTANLASLGNVTSGTWVEVDVTSLITSDGTYGVLVNSASTDQVGYSSKEATNKPQLILGVQ